MRARRTRLATGLLAAGLLLAGCANDGYHPSGPFRPLPQGAPPEVGPPTDSAPAPAPKSPSNPGSGQQQEGDPNVVASNLDVPTGLVVLPDGSAIVGERETGRLVQVFPDRSPARARMTVPGIDTGGDGGLLGLALSPTFDEDGLLYAYISTATDNRVVRFPIGGTPNPVLTGIPRGATHNGGGLLFAADGTLFVGTGDTGDPHLSQDPASLGGKILHIDVFGKPVGTGPVYASGLSDVTALCGAPETRMLATDESAAGLDELDVVVENGDYGFPTPGPGSTAASQDFSPTDGGLGGCAVSGSTVFVGALDGKRVHIVTLKPDGKVDGEPKQVLADQYGRLRTVVLDADGGLWVTTSNRDGIGTPAADDDKVLRIIPPTASGDSPL